MIIDHLAAEVIGELILDKNLGTNPINNNTWPVFVGQIQTDPDEAIGIVDTGRPYNGRFHRTGETQGHLGFQVTTRSAKYKIARAKAIELWKMFDGIVRYEISVEDKRYKIQAITNLMMPTFIGADPGNRIAFVLNCITTFSEA